MPNTLSDRAAADIVAAMGTLPEAAWLHGDDACDCTFQRIGLWKNPYLGETLEVRMCCIWAELYKLFPQFVRVTPAYLTGDDEWDTAIREWDGEHAMPRALWYRQRSRVEGASLPEIRAKYAGLTPPEGTPRPPQEPGIDPVEALFAMVTHLAERITELETKEAR